MIRALGALALALSLAACGGATLPPPQASQAGGAASGPPAATAMPAGTYTTSNFEPAVTFTVPEGWVVAGDTARSFQLQPGRERDRRDLPLPRPRRRVAGRRVPGPAGDGRRTARRRSSPAGSGASPASTAGNPAMATVGSLPAVAVDVGIAAGWAQSCPFAGGNPTVPLFYDAAGGYRWVVYGAERMRLYLVDLPQGGTVVVNIDTIDGPHIDQLIPQALPILRSMTFATDAAASPAASAPASGGPASASPSP